MASLYAGKSDSVKRRRMIVEHIPPSELLVVLILIMMNHEWCSIEQNKVIDILKCTKLYVNNEHVCIKSCIKLAASKKIVLQAH